MKAERAAVTTHPADQGCRSCGLVERPVLAAGEARRLIGPPSLQTGAAAPCSPCVLGLCNRAFLPLIPAKPKAALLAADPVHPANQGCGHEGGWRIPARRRGGRAADWTAVLVMAADHAAVTTHPADQGCGYDGGWRTPARRRGGRAADLAAVLVMAADQAAVTTHPADQGCGREGGWRTPARRRGTGTAD